VPKQQADLLLAVAYQPCKVLEQSPAEGASELASKQGSVLWRNLLAGLSLANLCFFPLWSAILPQNGKWLYLAELPPARVVYAAAVMAVTVVGVVCGVGIHWIETSTDARRRTVGIVVLSVFSLVLANAVRTAAAEQLPFLRLGGLLAMLKTSRHALEIAAVAGVGMGFVLVWAGHRARQRLLAAGKCALLALFPFFALSVSWAGWRITTYDPSSFLAKPDSVRNCSNLRAGKRVVWVVFDEWDERLTALAGKDLRNILEFRSEAVCSAAAYPPGADTLRSMAGLITGQVVSEVDVEGPDRLWLTLSDGTRSRLGSKPTVFSRSSEIGAGSALVGWTLPYSRLFAGQLCSCWWAGFPQRWNAVKGGFWEVFAWHIRSLFETGSASPFGEPVMVRRHLWIYQQILERGKRAALDPGVGLALLHFSVPHLPAIYRADTGRLGRNLSTPGGYLDNLKLVDRTVGDLRAAMEAAGLWDSTTVLLTSDHWFRGAEALDGKVDHRVPFLLKLAGQRKGMVYDKPFNTVLTHDLILAILSGELKTPDQVAAWLDSQRIRPEGQYRP